jgi:hypothetical protein
MKAILSIPDADGLRCVDILVGADGRFAFKEFRRDPEDSGRWTLTHDYSAQMFTTRKDALEAARSAVPWLASV